MGIYIFNVLALLIIYFVLYTCFSKQKAEKLIGKIAVIQMSLIAGLRGLGVGTDTLNYFNIFIAGSKMNLKEMFGYYIEPGYLLISKLIAFFGGNFQLFLIIISFIIYSGIYYLIKYESKNKLLSWFLFITIGYFSSTMNILRQYLALVLIIFAIVNYLENNSFMKSCAFIAIACLFHTSAISIIAILGYHKIMYRSNIKNLKHFKFIFFFASVFFVVFITQITSLMSSMGIIKYEYEFAVIGAGYSISLLDFNLIVKVACSILYFYIIKNVNLDIKYKEKLGFWNYINILSCFIYIASTYVSLYSRFNMYLSIFSIIFIPNLLMHIKERKLLIIVYFLFFIMFIISLPNKDTVPWGMGFF